MVTHTKIWQWAQPGAVEFGDYSLHNSQHFADRNNPSPDDWQYPGELPGFTIIKNEDSQLPGSAGCQIGKTEWFAEGVPDGITRDDVVVPPCCQLPPPVNWFDGLNPFGYVLLDPSYVAFYPNSYWLFARLTNDPAFPPLGPPPGVTVFYRQPVAGMTNANLIVFGIIGEEITYPFEILPATGPGDVHSALICTLPSPFTAGIVAHNINTNSHTSSALAPSLLAEPGDTLVCVWFALDLFDGEPPGGMTVQSALGPTPDASIAGAYQRITLAGETGERAYTLPFSGPWTALSFLIR